MLINMDPVRQRCRIRHPIVREALAELLGTMTLVFIGDSAIANNMALGGNAAAAINIPLGYATALAISVYATGGVSGGHLNPAVTLAMCLTGRCDLNRLLPFSIAQYFGGFIGAALTHGLFFDLFDMDPDHTSFGTIFYTCSRPSISTGGAFLDQVMGTALLLYGIMAITDSRNMQVPKGVAPLAIGLTLFGVITCSGGNTGAALNPARDFSPRLYAEILGYDAFKDCDKFWWIPLVACYVGAVVGAFIYFLSIELHHPAAAEGEAALELAAKRDRAPQSASRRDGGRSNPAYDDRHPEDCRYDERGPEGGRRHQSQRRSQRDYDQYPDDGGYM